VEPIAMMTRFLAILLVMSTWVGSAFAQSIHRNGFSSKDPVFFRGDSNIRFDEKIHQISDEHCKNAPTSERISIEANPPPGATEAEYVHYFYTTPPAPITDRLTARLWVKAYRAGIQIKARVVLPREKDPQNPDAPLSTLILGDTYEILRRLSTAIFPSCMPDLGVPWTKRMPTSTGSF
jgi:hypothetical protein